jgi:HSP20 family protein
MNFKGGASCLLTGQILAAVSSMSSGAWKARWMNFSGTTPDQVDVYVFAAGLDTKLLDISLQQNLLTISGERKAPAMEDVNYYRKERYDGSFRRLVTLPDDVDPEQVEAQYRDGILQIHLKRREASRPRQIEVK